MESRPAGVEKTRPPRSSTCENPVKGERITYSTLGWYGHVERNEGKRLPNAELH